MTKFPKLELSRLRHLGNILLVTLVAVSNVAAVPVIVAPVAKQQFLDDSGRPLAFGCVFTYASGTTSPLATYTDATGLVQNSNPVVLTAGGFAGSTGSTGLFLQAGLAYTIKVVTAGGTLCSLGTTRYVIDGIGGGTSVQTTIVPFSPTPAFPISAQNQLFEITLTGNAVAQPLTAVGITPPGFVVFQITQDGAGGHTFTWPSNSIGGAVIGANANQVTTQMFVWNGTNATAIGPAITGNGPSISTGNIAVLGSVVATGSFTGSNFISTCTNPATVGTLRLCKTDTIEFRNNANSLNIGISEDASDRGVWEFTGGFLLTGTTPDIFFGGTTASFPRLQRSSTALKVRLADNSGDAPFTALTADVSGLYALGGPEVSNPAAPGAGLQKGFFKASQGWCTIDSASVVRCIPAGGTTFIQSATIAAPCTTGASSFDTCDDTLTWPVTFGVATYKVVCTPQNANQSSAGESGMILPIARSATTVTVRTQTLRGKTATMGQIDCVGTLP